MAKNNTGRTAILIIGVVLVASLLVGLWLGFRRLVKSRIPPQPVFGFTGDWKMHNANGEEERPLPPAAEIWRDRESWKPMKENAYRFYLARLGHAERQLNFQSVTNEPLSLGDLVYTRVQFLYHDPTNGDYILSWRLNGKHDVNFLKFNNSEKWVQLQILGTSGTQPPQLEILGIEGFAPFYN